MSVSGTQITLKPFPRLTAPQAGLFMALLVTVLAGGLVVGRITAPSTQRATVSAIVAPARPIVSASDLVAPRIARELEGISNVTVGSVRSNDAVIPSTAIRQDGTSTSRPTHPRRRPNDAGLAVTPSLDAAIAWTIRNCTGWKPSVHVC